MTGVSSRATPELVELDPADHRDSLLRLFHRNGMPGFDTVFDWHYSPDSCRSRSWALKDTGSDDFIGFISVFKRTITFGDQVLRAGCPANLIVDAEARSIGAVVSLIRQTQNLVRTQELDLLIGFGNEFSDRLMERMGYRHINGWQYQHLMQRPQEKLRSLFGWPGVLVSPLVQVWTRWSLRQRPAERGFDVLRASKKDVQELEVSKWKSRSMFSTAYELSDLAWRFLDDPKKKCSLLFVRDASGSVGAYAALHESSGSAVIFDLRSDVNRLSDTTAVSLIVHALPGCDTISLPITAASQLAIELRSLGFIPGRRAHQPVRAFWLDEHPLARDLSRAENWALFPGYFDV